jgi:hypothetical protein
MNDTVNEVFYLTEDEKAKVTWYHLTSYKIQEERHDVFSCAKDAVEAKQRVTANLLLLGY